MGNVRIVDVSFVGLNDGWVLASTDCLTGSGSCSALLHSTDRGQHWTPVPPPPANVDGAQVCSSPCVEHIRFATPTTGYAYGADALFLTIDGGMTWTRQPGGADALQTRDGHVIRLLSAHGGCPGPCGLRAEISSVGSTRWLPTSLPGGPIDAATVSLQWASDGRAFLETSQGQAGSLYSVSFFISADDGSRWTQRPDPCRGVATAAAGVTMASSQMTVGPTDGSLSILCTNGGDSKSLVVTTTNGGSSFFTGQVVTANQFGEPLGPIGSASADVIISAGGFSGFGLYRSDDRGRTWTKVLTAPGNGDVHAPEFATTTTGYWITTDGRTLWTTHDTGHTWTATNFGGA